MPELIPAEVGWRNGSPRAALAFLAPEPLSFDGSGGIEHFGADLARRIVQIRCPFDLIIQVSPRAVRPVQFYRVPEAGGLSEAGFRWLVSPVAQSALRDPEVPAVQIALNLTIVTDELCTLHLMPPFLAPGFREWPGTVVSGRFPVRSWPRPLNCVLEWQDRGRDWVLRRGDPLVYLMFDFDDPRKVPRIVEAASTPVLTKHLAQVDDVTSFARNVGPMFERAETLRPDRLLTRKRIGCPDFS